MDEIHRINIKREPWLKERSSHYGSSQDYEPGQEFGPTISIVHHDCYASTCRLRIRVVVIRERCILEKHVDVVPQFNVHC